MHKHTIITEEPVERLLAYEVYNFIKHVTQTWPYLGIGGIYLRGLSTITYSGLVPNVAEKITIQQINELVGKVEACGSKAAVAFFSGGQGKIETKLNPSDQVSEFEKDIEESLIETVYSQFPTFDIFAEESGYHKSKSSPSTGTIFIDPIDGTSNFLHGIPYFSVSILIRSHGMNDIGIVYDPIFKRLHLNAESQETGAPDTGTHLGSKSAKDLTIAFVSGYQADFDLSQIVINRLWKTGAKRIMANWSPSLDFCRMAGGLIDAVVHCPGLENLDDNAGRAIAASYGMIERVIQLDNSSNGVPLHVQHMPTFPACFWAELQ